MKLNELKIVVTGGASGMGRHFSLRLAEAGARVVAADVNGEGLAATAEAAAGMPGEILPIRTNVAKEQEVIALMDEAWNAFDGLNGLVNNAGIFRDSLLVRKDKVTGDMHEMSLDQWSAVIAVDLTGPFLCTREFAKRVVAHDAPGGVIVNISSGARHGNRGQTNYSAAKAGLVADTVVWAKELSRYGIRTGAIAPGFVDTPILQGMRPEVLEGMLKSVPLRRAATPDEIFAGVRFVIECDYFTGRCIDIDGGLRL